MVFSISIAVLLVGLASAAPVSIPVSDRHLLGLGNTNQGFPLQSDCIRNGRHGEWRDGLCVLSDINLVTRDDPTGNGQACQLINGAPGVWQYGVCVRAGTTIHKKDLLNFNEGQPCEGAYGSVYWNEGLCVPILDGVVDIEPQNGLFERDPLLDGTPCWHEGKFGYLKHKHCVLDGLLDISLDKRYDSNHLDGSDPLVAGLQITGLTDDHHRGSLLGLRHFKSGYYDDDDVVSHLADGVGLGDLLVRSDEALNEERHLPLLGNKLGGAGGFTGA